ncbi:MAG: hypothetical protein P1U34_05170 [Coxiellaceae bacterium]|nr:hypothetical protein [Coxiellaceae bacterium]
MKNTATISLLTLLISTPLVCLADNPNAAAHVCDNLKNFTLTHPGLESEVSIPLTINYDVFTRHNNQLILTKRASFQFLYRPSICQAKISNNFKSNPDSYSKFRITLDNIPIGEGVIQPD